MYLLYISSSLTTSILGWKEHLVINSSLLPDLRGGTNDNKIQKVMGALRACKQGTNDDSVPVGGKTPPVEKSPARKCGEENTKIYNFLVMETHPALHFDS